jgi:catechol 2,3-dioxygenase-like lactoylglutathione lyase family enzyme
VLSFGMTVLGVDDMRRAIDFWTRALHFEVREGGPDARWTVLTPAGGGGEREGGHGAELALQLSESPAQEYPRVHVDLMAGDAAEQAAEVERLVGLGAERVDWDLYPDRADFVVLADTEGNRFCVVDATYAPD